MLHDGVVASAQDVFTRIRGALIVDAKRLREIATEQEKFSEAYNRYLALQRESRAHEESANALRALLGPDAFVEAMSTDKSDAVGWEIEMSPTAQELREKTALWQHVRQYLRFVPEAQAGEMVSFLQWVGIRVTRQAVESAIRSHPREFAVKTRGREKFISLKGA
jgi:hypothetical protein